jgi:ABC-type nitrate/sulfonate/bicarbonate transport system ATPase subunit
METQVPTSAAHVHVRGVSHSYASKTGDVLALDDVTLDVRAGEFVSVVGPSGCGKSTLLHLVAGFAQPTAGSVEVDGAHVRAPSPDRGVVFQRPNLYPWLSVRANVEFGLRMRRSKRASRHAIAAEHLRLVGLEDFARRRPYELSGGMQQRCQIARVLATDPTILLMDEPLGALDALTRERMQSELVALWQRSGKTVLFVTHSVDEAVFVGTRVVVMSRRPGRIVFDEPTPFPGERDDTARSSPELVAFGARVRAAIEPEAR